MFAGVEVIELFAIVMFFISFYGLISSKNVIKSIVSILLMEVAVIVFFLGIGFTGRAVPPVGTDLITLEYVADPLPQALMITAVIVGLATTAINITMFITLFRKYKTADWNTIKTSALLPGGEK
ncbi:MAG: cation:proton antiporter subunit C [Firmicutes bacterium]|nr:cation:proton antiporter subunit C [Bacillota bacterium]